MIRVKFLAFYILGFFPEFLFKLRFYKTTHQWLNISNPHSFYDKIAYLLFRTNTDLWTLAADKVRVKGYLKSKGLDSYCPCTYGVWDNANDIDFTQLPNQFVLKTNNACATNIIVYDKEKLDLNKTRKQLNLWLKSKYGHLTAQPHYSRIKPLILAEELLIDDETAKQGKLLIDYKFYCINGEPRYVQVMYDRTPNTHDVKLQLFDMNWNAHPEFLSDIHEHSNTNIDIPVSFSQMKDFARTLSKEFKFVRVDLYEINGKPILGELSFTPGFDSLSELARKEFGKLLTL